jgi:hypothetical protein
MEVDYEELFKDFKDKVTTDENLSAFKITNTVKEYFANRFEPHTVLRSAKTEKRKEYLTDILVTSFEPKMFYSYIFLEICINQRKVTRGK